MVAFLSRNREDRTGTWSAITNQVIQSIVYSGFIAVICLLYASHPSVQHTWVYAACGFIATFFALGSNVDLDRSEEGALLGAGIGYLAGLVAYPVLL